MKLRVVIDGTAYEVEIENIHARPVVAFVAGERFEVWPDGDQAAGAAPQAPVLPTAAPAATPPTLAASAPARAGGSAVTAPIPGVVVAVAVSAGDEVAVGQELVVIEAMKMQNSIRATRAGTIGGVRVSVGQSVRHRDVLLEYLA